MRLTRTSRWFLILILAGSVVVWFAYFSPGYVSQIEFSPDQLLFRANNYFALEFISTNRTESSTTLLDRIREYEADSIRATSPPRWHFVHGRERGVFTNGVKEPYRYLRDDNSLGINWIEWTDNHPELAKRVWPEIINRMRKEDYGVIPLALMAASEATTVDDFERIFEELQKKN